MVSKIASSTDRVSAETSPILTSVLFRLDPQWISLPAFFDPETAALAAYTPMDFSTLELMTEILYQHLFSGQDK